MGVLKGEALLLFLAQLADHHLNDIVRMDVHEAVSQERALVIGEVRLDFVLEDVEEVALGLETRPTDEKRVRRGKVSRVGSKICV